MCSNIITFIKVSVLFSYLMIDFWCTWKPLHFSSCKLGYCNVSSYIQCIKALFESHLLFLWFCLLLSPTLKNIYLQEFHPSLGLVCLIPKALKSIYQQFYSICRPKTGSKARNLEKKSTLASSWWVATYGKTRNILQPSDSKICKFHVYVNNDSLKQSAQECGLASSFMLAG